MLLLWSVACSLRLLLCANTIDFGFGSTWSGPYLSQVYIWCPNNHVLPLCLSPSVSLSLSLSVCLSLSLLPDASRTGQGSDAYGPTGGRLGGSLLLIHQMSSSNTFSCNLFLNHTQKPHLSPHFLYTLRPSNIQRSFISNTPWCT